MVERALSMREVVGSMPTVSISRKTPVYPRKAILHAVFGIRHVLDIPSPGVVV